jgi:simple sugar transport system ATP-binding protein
LVGENGAGKTTLMNILYGLYRPDTGQILINGVPKNFRSPTDAIDNGIGMVHQHFMLVDTLSVIDNIILGEEDTHFGGILNYGSAGKRLEQIINKFRLNINLNSKIETLSVGIQQKIEILKVLYRNSKILIFDEPTAVLTPQETDELFSLIKELKNEGKTIILISHKLGEVLSVSDRVTVLRHGKVTGEKITAETSQKELAEMIVGEALPSAEKKSISPGKTKILEVKNLNVEGDNLTDVVKDLSFEITSGEIFGIAGVEGSGQSELIEAIDGLKEIKSGQIKINGKKVISHIPSDRHKYGVVNEYSLSENVLLGRQNESQFRKGITINKQNITEYTNTLIKKYDVRPANSNMEIGKLSGGNQQKLVVSREMSKNSDLVIASHPARGLDIRAAEFVHNILIEERNKGKAILVVSSDLSELLKLSDRIGVMYSGKMVTMLNSADTNEREIGMYMTGAISNL